MIYYAEDDSSIRELVLYTLKNTGFEALGFDNGADLAAKLKSGEIPQLIITPPISEELIRRSASGALLTLKETHRPD